MRSDEVVSLVYDVPVRVGGVFDNRVRDGSGWVPRS